jgi:hypothetical protein
MQFQQAFLEEAFRRFRGDIDCVVGVVDCLRIAMSNFPLAVLKRIFHEVFNYYAERFFKIYVLNADFIIRSFYTIVKTFLPGRIVEKIIFIGSDRKEIFETLSEDFDIDAIPKRYGGKNEMVI